MRTFLAVVMLAGLAAGDARAESNQGKPVVDGEAAPADGAALEPAYAPLAAVAVVMETGQALLWDEGAGRYQLAMVGDVVAGWKVVAIEADKVIVTHGAERDVLQLVAPPKKIAGLAAPAPAPTPAKPEEPPPVVKPKKDKPPAPVAGGDEKHALSRAEFEREIGDFDKLAASADFKAAADGGFELTRVTKGSWLWRMGLRPGDIVRAVAGERVASIEDAARVYARLRNLRSFNVELDRPSDEDPGLMTRVVIRYDLTGK